MLKPIEFKKPPTDPSKKTEYICPSCGGEIINDIIPCPDGKVGCCVCHYGLVCVKCGGMFYNTKE
jgi:hypothetical protein